MDDASHLWLPADLSSSGGDVGLPLLRVVFGGGQVGDCAVRARQLHDQVREVLQGPGGSDGVKGVMRVRTRVTEVVRDTHKRAHIQADRCTHGQTRTHALTATVYSCGLPRLTG